MHDLIAAPITSVAVIGAHCDDIAMGTGATLMEIVRRHPDIVVHALVLTGGGTDREIEEKNAFASMCGAAEVRLTVADLPAGELALHRREVRQRLADFRAGCEPEVVFAPYRTDHHQDHRVVAELTPTEFRDHLVFGYENLKWDGDLPSPSLYLPIPTVTAWRKSALLHECYPSQSTHDWFDDDAFLGLMRVRGVQCRNRYAEAFVLERDLEPDALYSRN
ncbi:MAG: PIG-L family deacetylase [Mycobacteriaceae bacterium]|nr:PIG-L family deacetylase [Mycobacteriaceae bacterium]